MLRIRGLVLVLPLSAPGAAAASFCDEAGWTTTWRDEFEAETLDAAKWTVEHGVADVAATLGAANAPRSGAGRHGALGSDVDCHGAACATLGSCRDAACTRDSVHVRGGRLVLTSQRRHVLNRNFTTGAVNTRDKVTWRASAEEGAFRLCISAVLPGVPGRAQGVWPAHWLMPNDNSCDPDEGEMDIMEMINGDGTSYSTYHWQTSYPAHNCSYPTGHEHVYAGPALPSGWNGTLHEWAVERGPNHVAFALDSEVLLNASALAGPTPRPLLWDRPWYLILNTALGGGWPGPVADDTVFPITHEIEYVRVARRAAPV